MGVRGWLLGGVTLLGSMLLGVVLLGVVLLGLVPQASAQTGPPAARPPLGWNSWDAYALTINEAQFRANVEVEADRLRPAGYTYAVVDEGWYMENPEDRPTPEKLRYGFDAYGRFVPVPGRFPSAVAKTGGASEVNTAAAAGEAAVSAVKTGGASEAAVSAAKAGGAGEVNTPAAANGVGETKPAAAGGVGETKPTADGVGETKPATAGEGPAASFRPLSDWVHEQGLRFGIHIIRGIPKASVERNAPVQGSAFHARDAADTADACPWDVTSWGVRDSAAGQAWYDALFRQYADWGVDFVKVDCIAADPYRGAEIRMIRRALDRSGRAMVLSLSPGPTALAHAKEVGEAAQMWRISNDLWDLWTSEKEYPFGLKEQFARLAAWQPYARPGNWPDADMLPVGDLKPVPGWGPPRGSRLTAEEQRTMRTLWSIARSPLMVGGNLTTMDEATIKLLTNRDNLKVSQTALRSRDSLHEQDLIAWTAELPGTERALALVNTGEAPVEVSRSFADFGLPEVGWEARDAWARQDLGRLQRVKVAVPPHGAVLWMLDQHGNTEPPDGGDAARPPGGGGGARPPTVSAALAKEHVLKRVRANYSAIARAAHVTGEVVVGVEIDAEGRVTQAVVLSGPSMLRWSSLEAAKQCVFRPIEVDGAPAVVRSAVVFRFNDVKQSTSD